MALSTISGTTGITDATITSAKLADFTAAVDLNGVELLPVSYTHLTLPTNREV